MPNRRIDHQGEHRTAFEKNRKRLLATQDTCAICGRPIDKTLRAPHPLSPVVDHIIPIKRNGHPSDIDNLQLVHYTCNRMKGDKLMSELKTNEKEKINKNNDLNNVLVSNRNLPLSCDWKNF